MFLYLLVWGRRSRLIRVYVFNPLHVSGGPASETGWSTRWLPVDDQQCSRSHTKTFMLALRRPSCGYNIKLLIKTRPIVADPWRYSMGARKLPHEGHSDGGLDSHFTLPYNKLIFLRLMSYICIIYRSCLLLR